MDALSQYRKELTEYYNKAYRNILGLNVIEDKNLKSYLNTLDINGPWSHRNRLAVNIQVMKHSYLMSPSQTITACFKVTYDRTSCIYAYLYSAVGSDAKKTKHQFICAGPTYRSQDGEYRPRVIGYDQLTAFLDKYHAEAEDVEESVVRKITEGDLQFQVDFFYPTGFKGNRRAYEDSINTSRLPIKLYILCWLHDFYYIHTKTIENHVNPAYQYIIYRPEDIPILESIIERLGKVGVRGMAARASQYITDINQPSYNLSFLQVGQKIFPLTVFEAIRTDDINFNTWRELYITNMASNLVLNLISPGFSFINTWFYIQNAHAGLFDNLSMHDKYLHSSIAADISTQMKNIDKYNYVGRDRSKGPVSNKFLRLSISMQKSIIYADSDIRLTDLAACVQSEYVGRTLRDIPSLIALNEHLPGLERVFTDPDIFTRHMFEYVYSFYCMNTKIGIIHGDLHMNNTTMHRLYKMATGFAGKAYIVYIVGQKAYRFPHFGIFSTIIDFSRAILGDYKQLEHEFSSTFADMYFKEQKIRVMNMLYHYFPSFVNKHQAKLETLLGDNFPLMFKILTAIDTYVIMSNISAMFSVDDAFTSKAVGIAPGAVKLLDDLAKMAESLIMKNIRAAMEGRISTPDDIEWPNLIIMNKNFSDWVLTSDKYNDDGEVVEIFNHNNDIIYDMEDPDSWGPIVSIDKLIEYRKKYGIKLDEGIMDWFKYKESDESELISSLTEKYEQQEDEILHFEPWMLI